MSSTSPTSPRASLRRRGGRNSIGDTSNETSTSKQPISPIAYHNRSLSGTNDSFGDFIGSSKLGEEEKIGMNSSIDEDWQDADLVETFSPVTSETKQTAPSVTTEISLLKPPIYSKGKSSDLDAQDWAAWETPRGPSPQPPIKVQNEAASSQVDDNFFAAFEQATISQTPNKPSPPIIDLRNMEKILEERKQAKEKNRIKDEEVNFFDAFDRTPGKMMSSSRERSDANESLKGSQLENMREAQASPMNIISPNEKRTRMDYFGNNQDLLADSPTNERRDSGQHWLPSPGKSDSWTEAAGHWAGTFKKTLGSLRGQAAELAQHLPSAKDFIVPEEYQDEEEEDEAEEQHLHESLHPPETNGSISSVRSVSKEKSMSPTRRIAKAADYSQSTPFGILSATSPPQQSLARGRLNSVQQIHGSIKGAPGFDPNPVHNWNTGSWSLSSIDESQRNRKPIPVQLKGRREETQDVMNEKLASHLTAHFPKRMQLGKTWKLLYSSDQHGISLGTLYWKVQSGLDLSNGGRKNSGEGAASAEGWLRGASQATQEAVTGIRRVGGGLTLADAGLILAVRDSENQIFGAYVNERLRAQQHYYGNGECFLWKEINDNQVKAFKWTGRNDYMILTEAHYLSFGGGDGKYGLWIDGQLEKGISSKSPAFDNELLCSNDDSKEEGHFECITLEVWACGID